MSPGDTSPASLDRSVPTAPTSLEALGVPVSMVHKMLLKHLYIGGSQRTDELASKLCIPVSLLDQPIAFLKREVMLEAHRRTQASIGEIQHLNLTDRGRERAHAYFEENAYVGPMPVSYAHYCERVMAQTVKDRVVNREKIARAYEGLVIEPRILRQIGAAFNSGNSIFLFGPAGTGKTFIASQMIRLLDGDIQIPYAVEAHGQIIRVFDPAIHHAAEDTDTPIPSTRLLAMEQDASRDLRWIRCRRPVIVAAGELTLEMLDLKYQKETGFYDAPLQMRANGGLLLIDDLGRQMVNTSQLLNRWIMPLEYSEDYLSLHTGVKLRIPFDVLPVFSTNLSPGDLADEAFLRRLGYKIPVDYISSEDYATIFEQYCKANSLDYNPDMVAFLIKERYLPGKRKMTASHPKELINKVIDFSLYEGVEPVITKALLEQAWDAHFLS